MAHRYFLRHGESTANAARVIAGQTDVALTDKGRDQARQAAELIQTKNITIDRIITSPLQRTRDTATIIAEYIGYPTEEIIFIDELMERSNGSLEGETIETVRAKTDDEVAMAGGESIQQLVERVRVADRLIRQQSFGTTLIVGHAGWYRALERTAHNVLPHDIEFTARIENATLLEYPDLNEG